MCVRHASFDCVRARRQTRMQRTRLLFYPKIVDNSCLAKRPIPQMLETAICILLEPNFMRLKQHFSPCLYWQTQPFHAPICLPILLHQGYNNLAGQWLCVHSFEQCAFASLAASLQNQESVKHIIISMSQLHHWWKRYGEDFCCYTGRARISFSSSKGSRKEREGVECRGAQQ